MRNPSSGFPTKSDKNRALKPHTVARGLKFHIYEEKGLYYIRSDNKGADQLCSYTAADLRLVFAYAKSMFSHDAAHINKNWPSKQMLYLLGLLTRGLTDIRMKPTSTRIVFSID